MGIIVEDTTKAGGKDSEGRDVIVVKSTDNTVPESVVPTDPREARKVPGPKIPDAP